MGGSFLAAEHQRTHEVPLPSFVPEVFEFNPEAVYQPIRVRVIGGDLTDVENLAVGEAYTLKRFNVSLLHLGRVVGEFSGVLQHRAFTVAQCGGAVIMLDGCHFCFVIDQPTEARSVVDDSVTAFVLDGHRDRDHLPFSA